MAPQNKSESRFSECLRLPRICSKLHSLHYILFHLYIFLHFIIIYCWCLVLMVMSSTLVPCCCCCCSCSSTVDVVQRDVFNSACNLLNSLFNIFLFFFLCCVHSSCLSVLAYSFWSHSFGSYWFRKEGLWHIYSSHIPFILWYYMKGEGSYKLWCWCLRSKINICREIEYVSRLHFKNLMEGDEMWLKEGDGKTTFFINKREYSSNIYIYNSYAVN